MAEQVALPSTEQQAATLLVASGILDASAITPAPTQAEINAVQAVEIADLKARLEAQTLRGNNRPVEMADGELLPVTEAQKRMNILEVETQLELLGVRC